MTAKLTQYVVVYNLAEDIFGPVAPVSPSASSRNEKAFAQGGLLDRML